MTEAKAVRVRGVVQGVGFRPYVYRLAQANALAGWVLNRQDGVEIHLEGAHSALQSFLESLQAEAPPASVILEITVETIQPTGYREFTIRNSVRAERPTTGISPDLPVCEECLEELFDPAQRRHRYPYINCTNCGPRYTVIESLPYDRPNTTMRDWPLDDYCGRQYHDPGNRRFHAQPVACPACGPHYRLISADGGPWQTGSLVDWDAIGEAARLLASGSVLAIKGLGGYHLACDARRISTVASLRERKYRKEKPFALMARDLEVARRIVELSSEAEALLISNARPILLAPARDVLPGIAPDNHELGVMLPYAPVHHLLFAAGAPELLVMTSANRSSEPIAYKDEDALQRLAELADAFLAGERPIARRVDDSVARIGPGGVVILRRARGYAPAAVAELPSKTPILALGADLKSSVTLVVEGQAFVSQHIGDLAHFEAFQSFQETISDLMSMYDVDPKRLLLVSDCHPQYHSTAWSSQLEAGARACVQHHRAHVASVLAEHAAWARPVVGVSFDGTGYGDDGSIWGGEIFVGSLETGFRRAAHLRAALLAGGDAAARHPVQAAAGFLAQLETGIDYLQPPFNFPARYEQARQLLAKQVRTFRTTSMGRLFDTLAALLGFTRVVSFEGQAAMWLQHLAQKAGPVDPYPLPTVDRQLDFRPMLRAVVEDRRRGRSAPEIARAAHAGIAFGLTRTLSALCRENRLGTVVLSGGVFQNALLAEEVVQRLAKAGIETWMNQRVPPNDGGISLGQAALAAFGSVDRLLDGGRGFAHA